MSDRFAKSWQEWDDKVRSKQDVPRFLADARDEDLIELLAGASAHSRKYESDVVATEILNRLRRRTNDLPQAAEEVMRSAEAAYSAAAKGQRAIHKAESILKATGEAQLGADVSATAYASLDTTKLAFEAAQQNSADVQATVAQSRLTDQLARDAALTAQDGADATRNAAETLSDLGHEEAAADAHEAASEIRDAADKMADATDKEREAAGDG